MLNDIVCERATDNVVVKLGTAVATLSVLVAEVVAHAHELGQSLIGHSRFLEILGSLGCLLAAVHEYQHLLLTRMSQHLLVENNTFRTVLSTEPPNYNHARWVESACTDKDFIAAQYIVHVG